jgi:hypothetical protein
LLLPRVLNRQPIQGVPDHQQSEAVAVEGLDLHTV